ncbi:MAG: YfhD family protein [Bacillota bacterium]|uniref:YfhD family protein n=1 Tax=Virgibacillus salarius TaxID=447199 RepID=A0A941ICJ0_9BACI|nr:MULTISPECIES: YfhD family protein [Bacillaceae]NAZ10260.1 YfhD family protein [Agaribacter marinus]MBR7797551.1 YfhD family protein [Virgibacillus salarius]MCC2252322.1 YfhD family protein [Virgibacillus sp. AGTR]MDY7046207.1 YfhD family protein [Virgibacillus sp. M23]QRZ19506.1 YfhD family protein [Virgibacillus sp. AGTR]
MGKDEHHKSKNNFLSQTPKNQKSDGIDVEFSEELADHEDKEAQQRSDQANKRIKGK